MSSRDTLGHCGLGVREVESGEAVPGCPVSSRDTLGHCGLGIREVESG